jgi:hypothetical protein
MECNDRVNIRWFEAPQLHGDAISKRRGKYIVHKVAFGHSWSPGYSARPH